MQNNLKKRVDIKVGFECNNCCKFCVQANKKNVYQSKSNIEIKEIIKETVNSHNEVVFTGGEPTIRSDFLDLVKYAQKMGFESIYIQSNGRMFFYEDYCQKVIKAGANVFGLAIHGHNPEVHDSLTNADGSFKQTLQGIKNLVNLNQVVLVNIVVTKLNYKYLPKIADMLIGIGVNKYQFAFIHINPIIANSQKLINEIVPKKSEIIRYVKEGLDRGINAGIKTAVATEAIPFCFLEGYEDYISENGKIPNGSVYDAKQIITDYQKHRLDKGKKKDQRCIECKYYKICEGPWKEYPEIFGWKEFEPIKL